MSSQSEDNLLTIRVSPQTKATIEAMIESQISGPGAHAGRLLIVGVGCVITVASWLTLAAWILGGGYMVVSGQIQIDPGVIIVAVGATATGALFCSIWTIVTVKAWRVLKLVRAGQVQQPSA